MEITVPILLVLSGFISLGWCFIAFRRNQAIGNFRDELNRKIFEANKADIHLIVYHKMEVIDRYAIYEKFDWDLALRQFWKPLDSYFTDEEMRIMTTPLSELKSDEVLNAQILD